MTSRGWNHEKAKKYFSDINNHIRTIRGDYPGETQIMHEYPITEQLIKIASNHCEKAEAEKVVCINLVVGDYSGFVPESIHMYFDLIAAGTVCEGAELNIERIKPKIKCPACGEIFERKPMSFACPKCGTDGEPTDIGKEFYIDSIEVE